jgi:hypothetical protein
MKRPLLLLISIAMVATAASCIFDPDKDETPPINNDQKFENLSEKWHVLNNIELAYSKRRLDKYDQLLDNDFAFFLFPGDVGGDVPESWDRDTEVSANKNLFSTEQPPAPAKRCLGIRMNVQWEDDQGKPSLAWIELTPPGSSETWYTTTVNYDFNIDVEGDLTYINNPGAQAQFTIRNAGTEGAPQWRLVEFRDLGSD